MKINAVSDSPVMKIRLRKKLNNIAEEEIYRNSKQLAKETSYKDKIFAQNNIRTRISVEDPN